MDNTERTCDNCRLSEVISDYCPMCRDFRNWEPKETIKGVADSEIVSNAQGGKQSRLDYRFDLIDAKAMFELARVMHEGAKKYERDNWRKIDVESHLNHAISHAYAYLAGDKQDKHLSHALARVKMALAVSLQEGNKND